MKPAKNDTELYWEEATKALPILVRLAKAKEKIPYGPLGKLIGINNPRIVYRPLELVGNKLKELGGAQRKIPQIQCIVVRQDTKKPGDGIFSHIRGSVENEWEKIFGYKQWDSVLDELGLPASSKTASEIRKIKNLPRPSGVAVQKEKSMKS